MSHIPASAMPHAAPKHHDDEGEAQVPATGSLTTAPDETPAVMSPSPVFEPAPPPVPDAKTPAPSADAQAKPHVKPARGRRVGVALAAGAVAVVAGLVAFGVPRLGAGGASKREG